MAEWELHLLGSRLACLWYCFVFLGPLGAFPVCPEYVFRSKTFFAAVCNFPCVFLALVAVLLNVNSVVVFVAFFLLCFLLCCFAVFALYFLSLLCPALKFILGNFLPGALRFPWYNYFVFCYVYLQN